MPSWTRAGFVSFEKCYTKNEVLLNSLRQNGFRAEKSVFDQVPELRIALRLKTRRQGCENQQQELVDVLLHFGIESESVDEAVSVHVPATRNVQFFSSSRPVRSPTNEHETMKTKARIEGKA